MDCTTSACPVEMSAFQLNVIEWGFVSAMDSRLVVDLMVQSDYATCDYDQRVQAATFQINGTDLFLYSTEEPDFQHIFVNPSSDEDAKQAEVGYVTGGQIYPQSFEFQGWSTQTEGNVTTLHFDGEGDFYACYEADGTYTVSLAAGDECHDLAQPCTKVYLEAYEVKNPIGCQYTFSDHHD